MSNVVNLREYIKKKIYYIERLQEAGKLLDNYREVHLITGCPKASANTKFYQHAQETIKKELVKMGVAL